MEKSEAEHIQPKLEEQAQTATESASAMEKSEAEDIQPKVEEQPTSKQELVEEAHQPLPPPSEEVPSGAKEMSPSVEMPDFPPPPNDDSGFQSPTSEKAEEEVPQHSKEGPEATKAIPAAAAEINTDSAREQE